ncbi:hypothetical protein NIES4071_53510 [Calothrix sp. NIES-4071]|nr:hypothetical protein NIES4071_53510 [Calothrix sp. NIES-4071]BAZ59659.1 hypothetical protein NIES4105_53460 [Calothrix sp. NIES-4105]
MPNIRILELRQNGHELFEDSESFLVELTNQELSMVNGGSSVSQVTYSVGYEYLPTDSNLTFVEPDANSDLLSLSVAI